MSSNNSKCVIQTDLKGNIRHFDATSLRCANALEKYENEYHTMENDRMSEYQVLQTIPKYCSLIEDSDTEVLEMDTRNNFPLFRGYISEEIPNSIVKCCDSSEESCEIKQETELEIFENEYHTMANDEMLEFQVYETSPKYSLPIENSDTEVLEIDKKNKFPLSQGYISEEISNLHVKCCDPREEISEHKRKNLQDGLVTLSAVGRCIRNACDSLLEMDTSNTDQLLENTDYQLMDLISFDSKQQASFSEVELLDVNVENKNEITTEKLESEKYQLKQDSSLFHSLSNNSSETSSKESNFKTSIKTYGIHEQNPSENDYQRKHTEEKMFQCDECQRPFSNR
ncbi:hypothetical protein NPIL_321521, partial [Nephila pilipes]